MKILLINANPVVSRLLLLCARDTHLLLDEVNNVDEVKDVEYDLVFVDDGSYIDNVDSFLEEGNSRKKIFLSYVKEMVEGFDETIQKPFLPSQIIKVIEGLESTETMDKPSKIHSIFPLASEKKRVDKKAELPSFPLEKEDESSEEYPLAVLDSREIDKIKALLEMDDEEIETIDNLSEDEVHFRKVKVIKEQLISEGLEILDEDEIINVLSTKKKEKKALKCEKNKLKQKKEQKQKQSLLACSKEELSLLEVAVARALASLKPKKMQKFLEGNQIKLKIKLEDND